MSKQKHESFVKGQATHCRTERDYMGVLLDTVSLEDWREVIAAALQAAKSGDSGARAWLAQYLVGKPQSGAPTPLSVVVQQWSGDDPLVEQLAQPLISSALFPALHDDDGFEEGVRARIAAEISKKLPNPERDDVG